MKKILLATLAFTLAAPAFAGSRTPDAAPASVLVDSHGSAVVTKDNQAVSIAESTTPAVAPEKAAAEPVKKAKVAKKKVKAKAKKAAAKTEVKKEEKAK